MLVPCPALVLCVVLVPCVVLVLCVAGVVARASVVCAVVAAWAVVAPNADPAGRDRVTVVASVARRAVNRRLLMLMSGVLRGVRAGGVAPGPAHARQVRKTFAVTLTILPVVGQPSARACARSISR